MTKEILQEILLTRKFKFLFNSRPTGEPVESDIEFLKDAIIINGDYRLTYTLEENEDSQLYIRPVGIEPNFDFMQLSYYDNEEKNFVMKHGDISGRSLLHLIEINPVNLLERAQSHEINSPGEG